MARAYPLTDLVKLVRAYGVLAGTSDADRTIAGTLSRRWIATEVERFVPLSSLPDALFRTQRGRDLLAAEFYSEHDIDPELIRPEALDIAGAPIAINSNRLPKLEPLIHQSVLAANILLGVRLYGNHGTGMPSMTHDMIVATMLQDALHKPYRYSAISPTDHEIVDDAYILTWFDDAVATHVRTIAAALDAFEAATSRGEPPPEASSPEIATVIAAVMASRLRLTARAAGDHVISFLDADRCAELAATGVECSGDFPERPFLERDYYRTVTAFALKGVDHYALREPLRNTLVMAVRDALDDPAKRERLSGRRGKAVHEVHINLPVMEYFVVAEAPNSIETVHIASLEMMRSLEKGRRKSLSTMSAHAFRIAAIAERVLGRALEPIIVTLALLHDVVEDGAIRVTGYGHSLRKIQFRFGGPIAAMVSELTDSHVHTAGAAKATLTLEQPHLLSPQAQYNVDRYTAMELEPTGEAEPYTLSGIVIKLLDTVVSLEEGIRDPELMSGHWRHSGARIYWAERVRGSIVAPLVERLLIELRESHDDPKYRARPHHVNSVRLRAGLALLDTTLSYQDMYAIQNLAILAHEYGLDASERDRLLTLFRDPNVDEAHFRETVLEGLLDDGRLAQALASGRLPELGYTTLYPRGAKPDTPRSVDTFLRYRASELRRQEIRHALPLDTVAKLGALALRREHVLRVFDTRMAEFEEDVRAAGAAQADRVPVTSAAPSDSDTVSPDSAHAGDSSLAATGS